MKKLSLLLLLSPAALSAFSFEEFGKQMDEQMRKMDEVIHQQAQTVQDNMDKARDEIATAFATKNSGASFKLEEVDNNAVLTFSDIKGDSVVAKTTDNDLLTIIVDGKTIKVHAQNKFLSVAINQQVKQETKDDNQQSSMTSYSSSQVGKTLSQEVDLNNVSVEKDGDVLTVKLPMKKSKTRTIPVNIKK